MTKKILAQLLCILMMALFVVFTGADMMEQPRDWGGAHGKALCAALGIVLVLAGLFVGAGWTCHLLSNAEQQDKEEEGG